MSEQDNNNIYILEEKKNEPGSSSDENLIEEDDVDETEGDEEEDKRRSVFLNLLEIMFNPVEGWKKIRRNKITVEEIQSGCFYPLLAVLAVSQFVDYFYTGNFNLGALVTEAVVAFVSYFLGYFCIMLVLSLVLPKEIFANIEDNFGKVYVITGLSTLVIFSIFTELLPMLWPVLIFLPLWTVYILYKGSRFFKLEESKELKFMIISCAVIIGMPYLIDWGLNQILPY